MQRRFRLLTALLAAVLALGLLGGSAWAAGVQAPWFQVRLSRPVAALNGPVALCLRYVRFWRYAEGHAWSQYNQWRLTQHVLPPIYVVRSAVPLPTLMPVPEPAAPEPDPAPVPVPDPDPAPAPDPDPTLVPEPEPAPAPEPDPMPEPEPDPDPMPVPEPEPAPAPEPEPEPEPAPVPGPEPAPAPEPDPTPVPDPAPAPQPEPAPDPDPAPSIPAGLTAEERQMVALVNAERAERGLPPLTVDMRLVATARAKSRDMIVNDYFSHTSPTLGSPFDQMRAAGIRYRTAGENLAGNHSVEAAHRALMNSPGHRANILSSRFTKIGVGIVRGGPYGMMFTQQFIGE